MVNISKMTAEEKRQYQQQLAKEAQEISDNAANGNWKVVSVIFEGEEDDENYPVKYYLRSNSPADKIRVGKITELLKA